MPGSRGVTKQPTYRHELDPSALPLFRFRSRGKVCVYIWILHLTIELNCAVKSKRSAQKEGGGWQGAGLELWP